jgi:hypothetical protein
MLAAAFDFDPLSLPRRLPKEKVLAVAKSFFSTD